MKEEKVTLLALFGVFLKLGALTFGGGYTTISLVHQELVVRRRWLEEGSLLAGASLAQAVPGANAVNTAVFVGYQLAGLPGAVVAAVATLLPALLVAAGGFTVLRYLDLPLVARAFQGLKAGVLGLLLVTLCSWVQPFLRRPLGLGVSAIVALLLLGFHWHPLLVFFVGAFLGFLASGVGGEAS